MLSTIQALVILAVGVAVLIFSADRLLDGGEKLGSWLGLSPFSIGVIVLAVGTSIPEWAAATFAVYNGNSEMVLGTVLGSNVANILLIIGAVAVIGKSCKFERRILSGEMPVLMMSLVIVGTFIYPQNFSEWQSIFSGDLSHPPVVSPWEGALLVICYVIYIFYYGSGHSSNVSDATDIKTDNKTDNSETFKMPFGDKLKIATSLLIGLVGLPIGAHYTIQAAVDLAQSLSLYTSVVAASIVALGTSLPELVVSMKAVRKGQFGMVMGNITGSNMFNTFIVLGVPALMAPFIGSKQGLIVETETVAFFQYPFYALTLIIFMFAGLDLKINRGEGLFMLIVYGLFVAKLLSLTYG